MDSFQDNLQILNGQNINQLLKRQKKKKIAADDILNFYYYLSMKIKLDFSCESSETLGLIVSEKQ